MAQESAMNLLIERIESISNILPPIAAILNYATVVILLWGFIISFIRWTHIEFGKNDAKFFHYQQLRRSFGIYIILGLEFMIVADLMESLHKKTLESLYFLGIIVVIRTFISYFLGKEMEEAKEEEKSFAMGYRSTKMKMKSSEEEAYSPSQNKSSSKKKS